MALLRRLTTATAVSTLLLVAIGGVVRATGSGDACPDWPRCFGSWLPPFEFSTIIEYSHRLAAAITGLLIFATAWFAWRRHRSDGAVVWPIVAAVFVAIVQAAIGRERILSGPDQVTVTVHFVVGMALVALVIVSATATRVGKAVRGDPPDPALRRLAWATLGLTAAILVMGAYVRGEHAGLAFLDWPLMGGSFVPPLDAVDPVVHFAHRALALLGLGLSAALAWRGRRSPSTIARRLAWTALGLMVLQTGIGAAAVLSRLDTVSRVAHVVGSSLAWASVVALVTAIRRLTPAAQDERSRPRRVREAVGAYVQLMKPDIILLLLVTTIPAMVLAAHGVPPAGLLVATLLGGTAAAGGANAINCYLDRDIDQLMRRTRHRPIPARRVPPDDALWFGVALVAFAFTFLAMTVNVLAASLTLAAAAFYVLVYTMGLKRSTPQNIVIGGAAGAVPALVGWAAVTGTVGMPAVVLFATVFVWTPPHFWALALKYAGEYRAAGVPMLPAVRGARETAVWIVLYSLLVVAVSLLLIPVASLGSLYISAAIVLGGLLLWYAVRVLRDRGVRSAMAMFHYSITYLGLLFAAAAVDELLKA
jgi:protoheme IX farnesyltransferase